ncbi:hypothetical protein J2Z32_002132 [Paenibacillus turicensis]|uniref:Uncharacterized protein n=1 Tax=Paenibacillus turicensis TaxID=160487 RepID=A0ABS4FSG2_9BACL|nr:hypothetical protein [Paenibacillus turicensis]MBP1905502.1 hypothetical protein [Paenibacillus turicensis]
MRPLIIATFVNLNGIKPLFAAQLYDKHGNYTTSVVCPCDNPELAVQVALEMVEFAGYFGIVDFHTSDRSLFVAATLEPDLNTEIVHESDTSNIYREVVSGSDIYLEFYPEEQQEEIEEERPKLTGWRAKAVRFLEHLILKIYNMEVRSNEKVSGD